MQEIIINKDKQNTKTISIVENGILIEQYIEKIQKVTKQDIVNVANSININTIYFLRDFTK